MTRVTLGLVLIVSACATKPSQTTGVKGLLLGRPQTTISQAVGSEREAEKILRNKQGYFRSLFEQSFDPYYGTPKFDEACLRENVIGELKHTGHMLSLHLVLALNSALEAGFCASTSGHRANLSHMLFYHCKGSGVVSRLVVAAKPGEENIDWGELCPN